MNEHQEELPAQRVAGIEYLACEYCGEPVSQLGTRTPRRYCKRSHRQRAYELRARKAEIGAAVEAATASAEPPRRLPVLPTVDPAVLRAQMQAATLPPDPPAVRPAVSPASPTPTPAPRPQRLLPRDRGERVTFDILRERDEERRRKGW